MAACGGVCLVLSEPLLRQFSTEPKIVASSGKILWWIIPYQVADAVALVVGGALNGAGDTKFSMIARISCGWGIMMPVAAYSVLHTTIDTAGLWSIGLVYVLAVAVFNVVRWRAKQQK